MTDLTIIETPRRKPRKTLQRKYPTGGTKKRSEGKLGRNKPKEKSISKLIKECDAEFSKKVRMVGAWEVDGIWYNKCYTHDVEQYRILPIKKLQCGHYLTRWYKASRWDYDNCRPQCYVCNMRKKGMPIEFRINLVKEIGLERVEAVEAKRNISLKLTREYLSALLVDLTSQKIDK